MKARYCMVITTADSRRCAEKLAGLAVREKAAACGQVIGPMKSVYRWKGKVETAKEWIVFLKTASSRYGKLESLLLKNHPYDMPEIISVPVIKGSPSYLKWIGMSVS